MWVIFFMSNNQVYLYIFSLFFTYKINKIIIIIKLKIKRIFLLSANCQWSQFYYKKVKQVETSPDITTRKVGAKQARQHTSNRYVDMYQVRTSRHKQPHGHTSKHVDTEKQVPQHAQPITSTLDRERTIRKSHDVIEDDASSNTPKMKYTRMLRYCKSESKGR